VTLWEVDIYPAEHQPNLEAQRVASEVADLGLADQLDIHAAHGYLLEGDLCEEQVAQIAHQLLADTVVEKTVIGRVGQEILSQSPNGAAQLIHVLPKPGVMDPVAMSAKNAIADAGVAVDEVRTFKKYWLADLPANAVNAISTRVLANDSIEQVVT
jgi:phosphoribosylformylglycinamidine (FGAM) synthase PurS component